MQGSELTVGKVMLKGEGPAAIWTAGNNREINHKNDYYEVLACFVYSPHVEPKRPATVLHDYEYSSKCASDVPMTDNMENNGLESRMLKL